MSVGWGQRCESCPFVNQLQFCLEVTQIYMYNDREGCTQIRQSGTSYQSPGWHCPGCRQPCIRNRILHPQRKFAWTTNRSIEKRSFRTTQMCFVVLFASISLKTSFVALFFLKRAAAEQERPESGIIDILCGNHEKFQQRILPLGTPMDQLC